MLRASTVGTLLIVLTLAGSARADDFSCTKPVAFPDRWEDVNKDGTFEPGIDSYDPAITGYAAPGDVGLEMTLHQLTGSEPPTLGEYFVVDLPPLGHPVPPLTGTGATAHWFEECPPYGAAVEDSLQLEPAGMAGKELIAGLDTLIAADPDAFWGEESKRVMGSAFAESPRSIVFTAYDPNSSPQYTRNFVVVAKLVRVFVESTGANSTFTVRFQDIATDLPSPVRAIT